MQVAQSMSRCASAGERDERALSPARRDVDVSHALDTIGFRIEIVGCAQSRFPNCRTAGAFGEFPVPRCKFPQPRWIAAHRIAAGLPNGLTINTQGGGCRACSSHNGPSLLLLQTVKRCGARQARTGALVQTCRSRLNYVLTSWHRIISDSAEGSLMDVNRRSSSRRGVISQETLIGIKVSGDPLRFRRTRAEDARKPTSRKRVLQKKSAHLMSPILSPCPTLSPN
jgi:hypothetical protein